MKLKRLISLPHIEAVKIRKRQNSGTMGEFYDEEQYLCFDADEYKKWKPRKNGRPIKRRENER